MPVGRPIPSLTLTSEEKQTLETLEPPPQFGAGFGVALPHCVGLCRGAEQHGRRQTTPGDPADRRQVAQPFSGPAPPWTAG